MLSRREAIDLLRQRQQARKANDTATIQKLDRQISAAVSKKEWPEIRTDSADNGPSPRPDSRRPISKAPDPEGQYLKAPPSKDWDT